MMSFLESIGNLMKGSGIEEFFIEVYAENPLGHIMSGKAVSRSLRSHFLTEAVLITLLLEQVFDSDMIETKRFEGQLTEALKTAIQQTKKHSLKQICQQQPLSQEYRTAKLWLLHIYYLDVLNRFIIAERTSNWAVTY